MHSSTLGVIFDSKFDIFGSVGCLNKEMPFNNLKKPTKESVGRREYLRSTSYFDKIYFGF